MLQPKDTDWVNEYKHKIRTDVIYEWFASDLGKHTDWNWKKVFHENENQKKAGVAIFTSDKIDFKIKTVTRETKGILGSVSYNVTRKRLQGKE